MTLALECSRTGATGWVFCNRGYKWTEEHQHEPIEVAMRSTYLLWAPRMECTTSEPGQDVYISADIRCMIANPWWTRMLASLCKFLWVEADWLRNIRTLQNTFGPLPELDRRPLWQSWHWDTLSRAFQTWERSLCMARCIFNEVPVISEGGTATTRQNDIPPAIHEYNKHK